MSGIRVYSLKSECSKRVGDFEGEKVVVRD